MGVGATPNLSSARYPAPVGAIAGLPGLLPAKTTFSSLTPVVPSLTAGGFTPVIRNLFDTAVFRSTSVSPLPVLVAVTVHVDSVKGRRVVVVGAQAVSSDTEPWALVKPTGRCRSRLPASSSRLTCPKYQVASCGLVPAGSTGSLTPLTVMVSFTDSPGRRVKFFGVTEIVAPSGAVADAR